MVFVGTGFNVSPNIIIFKITVHFQLKSFKFEIREKTMSSTFGSSLPIFIILDGKLRSSTFHATNLTRSGERAAAN